MLEIVCDDRLKYTTLLTFSITVDFLPHIRQKHKGKNVIFAAGVRVKALA